MTTVSATLYADVACAHSYVGYRQLRPAIDDLRAAGHDLHLTIRPLLIVPDAPIDGSESLQEVHRRVFGDQWRTSEIGMEQRGAASGAPFDFARARFTSTIPAHAVIQQAQAHDPRLAEELLDRLFAAYFMEGETVSDTDWLRELNGRLGLPEPDLSDPRLEAVRSADTDARASGVHGAPTLVLQNGAHLVGARSRAEYTAALDRSN